MAFANPITLIIVAALAYAMAVDENVSRWIVLQSKRLGIEFRRAFWIVKHHPATPWARWHMNRRAWRIASELQKSLNSPNEESEVS